MIQNLLGDHFWRTQYALTAPKNGSFFLPAVEVMTLKVDQAKGQLGHLVSLSLASHLSHP